MKKAFVWLGLSSLTFLFLANTALAQSSFLEKGKSGFGISATVQESFWEDGYFIEAGYSFNGVFDVAVAYGDFTYDKIGWDFKETELGVGLEYWVLRTRTGTDRGIDVGLWTSYSVEEYKEDGTRRYTGNDLALGIEMAINFTVNDSWFLQPYFVLGYSFDTIKEESTGETESYRGGVSSIGAALGYKLDNGNSIVFSFEQDSDSIETLNDTAYEITVGYNRTL